MAGLAGVVLLLGAVAVVAGLGLPDASDPETLTDFADIESGRIAEEIGATRSAVASWANLGAVHMGLEAWAEARDAMLRALTGARERGCADGRGNRQ